MEEQVRLLDRVRYWLDNLFARGTPVLVLWLALVSGLIVTLAAGVIHLADIRPAGQDAPLSFGEAIWEAMMRTLDPGTMGGDSGWRFRFVMFMVTIGGVFIISSLIGVLSNGMEARVDELRKGRSRVIERQHTVILGWSEQIFTILNELVEANANQRRRCIVVLAGQDKVQMDDAIRDRVDQRRLKPNQRSEIVTRTGSSIDAKDLSIVNLNQSRAIIVLSPQDSNAPDAEVIKTVLAMLNAPGRRAERYHIVAELRDPRNFSVAQLVGKDEVEWVLVGDLVARIVAQTCRQSGLSAVYQELLDFKGMEIYFADCPHLTGKPFCETLTCAESNAVLGIAYANGSAQLNPPMQTILQPGDRLVLLAEDDDRVMLGDGRPELAQSEQIAPAAPFIAAPERTLVLGWNWRGPTMLRELDQYVPAGSAVVVVADLESFADKGINDLPALTNQRLTVQQADTTSQAVLEALDLARFEHVIVLSYLADTASAAQGEQPGSRVISAQRSDARTLITLLHLRHLADCLGCNFSITSEMLDLRNRQLADVTRADDFIISDQLISLMLAQVAENKTLNRVFADLFDPRGSEVYLKPVENYVTIAQPVNFYTVLAAAQQRGEVAIGYRLAELAQVAEKDYGVVLNPPKSGLLTFQPADRLVLLAEN